ncbi:MAG: Protein translocase subunit SecF [Parcubacteria group bacterium GW2011_GWA2_39_18]|nr:MAG: Protein translocase subunit SecF [Parcubacteria group bacterium GW2011_GWA2_39_18]
MLIIKYRKIFFILSSLLIIGSLVSLFLWKLNFGIDFSGGALLEASFNGSTLPSNSQIKGALSEAGIQDAIVQPTSENSVILRFETVDDATHQKIILALSALAQQDQKFEEKSFESIGPAIGQELKKRAVYAALATLVGILFFISFAFRKVSRPVSSFEYAVAAILALFHDLIITLGIFSFLGKFAGYTVDLPFVAAILTVLGYSVNDTIVVFDRVRENLIKRVGNNFEETVSISINQTFVRSLATSATVFIALLTIYFFGGESTKNFSLALIVGIFFGTYSSIFIASTLLVSWYKKKLQKS